MLKLKYGDLTARSGRANRHRARCGSSYRKCPSWPATGKGRPPTSQQCCGPCWGPVNKSPRKTRPRRRLHLKAQRNRRRGEMESCLSATASKTTGTRKLSARIAIRIIKRPRRDRFGPRRARRTSRPCPSSHSTAAARRDTRMATAVVTPPAQVIIPGGSNQIQRPCIDIPGVRPVAVMDGCEGEAVGGAVERRHQHVRSIQGVDEIRRERRPLLLHRTPNSVP